MLNEQGEDVYWAITHAEGFYRDIFKKFKGAFERIFITGVSPVTLDDVTSGFNIGWHISTKEEFNQMLGFSTEDVREIFTYYQEKGMIPADRDIEAIINEMKPWYDNYCYSKNALETQSKVFNCDMVLYYLHNYMRRGQAPEQMLDPNTKMDYNKMKKLLQLDKLDGDRKGVIKTIREKYPEANISPVDYDPGSSETNQANRIKLLMTVAKDNLQRQENEKKALEIENKDVEENIETTEKA